MELICYRPKRFNVEHQNILDTANDIIQEYAAQGYDMTLRQLYYQFVARDLIANRQQEYKRLGTIINDGRLAGVLPWDAIVDRTRFLRGINTVDDPGHAITRAADQYHIDLWEEQSFRIEVWIEKDALIGAIERVCNRWNVDFFSCRGNPSQSEVWGAARRLMNYSNDQQTPVILYLGDHDPTGIDITRDVRDRMTMFFEGHDLAEDDLIVERIALNMDQVEEFNPPPNPTKMTDSRAKGYVELYGNESWELDALDPATLSATIQRHIEGYVDQDQFDTRKEQQAEEKEQLQQAASQWDELVDHLDTDAE